MTIYLTNLARASAVKVGRSTRFAGEVGPGPVLGILRWPPGWTKGLLQGEVVSLMPTEAELTAVRAGGLLFPDYLQALRSRWGRAASRGVYRPAATPDVAPATRDVAHPVGLSWSTRTRDGLVLAEQPVRWDGVLWARGGHVPDGSTLCCACELAAECHRSVAAEVLAAAGWEVVLDGVRVEKTNG